MKRNKFCPYKATCRDHCYEDTHCDFAKAFDRLGNRIECLELEKHNLKIINEKLRLQNEALKKQLSPEKEAV